MAKQLMVMENGASTNGDLDVMVGSWRCWHKGSKRRMGKFKSCRRKMRGWQNN
jgi:7-cyano-7-deazaguanine synthase in queuosine biosynthesis